MEKYPEAFFIMENLFKDPVEFGKRVYDMLRNKKPANIDPEHALALLIFLGLSERDYISIKQFLDKNNVFGLPCYDYVSEAKDR